MTRSVARPPPQPGALPLPPAGLEVGWGGARTIALLALILVGCGSRSALEVGLDAGARPPTPGVDSGRPPLRRDAGRPPVGVDAGRPPPGDCELGMIFDVVEGPGRFERPALARGEGRDAMLVFTERDGIEPSMWALPITPSGNPRAVPVRISEGEGGTVVPYTIGRLEAGFTTVYVRGGSLGGARMDPLAESVEASVERIPVGTVRPMLVLGERFAARGWTEARMGSGLLDLLAGSGSVPLSFPGVDMVGALGPGPDRLRVASHDGAQGYLEAYDATDGSLVGTEVIGLPPASFPVATGGIHIVDNHPDALVLWGGTVRALFDGILYARLAGAETNWLLAETNLLHTDAAYDERTGWLGMASAVQVRDASIYFHGLHASGATEELLVAEGVAIDGPPDPAILDVGPGEPAFLIVWPDSERGGSLRGAHIRCD